MTATHRTGRPRRTGTATRRALRAGIDRVLVAVAWLALRASFRRVEVVGRRRTPTERPMLVVANHFYGFVDPVMLMLVFGRLPRFVAKATLWEHVWLRPLLALAGMIPVHRRVDRTGGVDNAAAFESCAAALADGALVGIFPEGTTHDDPSIHNVRTGAARIALGALRAGVAELAIVPIGLTFEDKIALRSSVLATVGDPIDVDEVAREAAATGDADDRHMVRALTRLITQRLREVAPDYDTVREEAALRRAASIHLRAAGSHDGPPLADSELLARRLARSPAASRRAVVDALARYQLDLQLVGLRDRQVASPVRAGRLVRRTLATTAVLAVLAPLALVGAAWNVLPFWAVKAVGWAVATPVTKGTARLVAALVVFPMMWIAVVLLDPFEGLVASTIVLLLAPALGLLAVGWSEAFVRVRGDWRGWVTLTERRALLPTVQASRAAVVEEVDRTVRAMQVLA